MPPDSTDDLEQRVRADIERAGWHGALVPPEAGSPGWACSIGLYERFEHPELIVFGPDLQMLYALLAQLATRVAGGRRFEAGDEPDDILDGQRLVLRPVARKWYGPFLGNVAWHYGGEEFPTLQAFWPDPGGRMPWEPGADASWADDQPRLFEDATHRALGERLIEVLRHEGAL